MSGFLRARAVAARASAAGETGDTMIEVIVAALLVALIAAGVLTGFGQVSTLSGGQRQRAQATALAQQDQARLRGLALTQLSGVTGNTGSTQVLDGTTYTVTSKSQFITGNGGATCTAGQSGNAADEVAISSTVTWPNIGKRPPVVIHSVVAPPVGGALVVSATTPVATGTTGSTSVTGLAGMTATLTGPTTTSPLTTDLEGCAIFPALTAGSYTLSLTPPAGYVDKDGNTTIASQTPTVTETQTLYASTPTLAQPGAIAASFQTTYDTGATGATGPTTVASQGDQFAVSQGSNLTPGVRLFGTDSTPTSNSFASTVNSGMTLYPTATPLQGNYSVQAGSCNDAAQGGPGVVSASVSSGQTTNVTLPEPAMIVLPYTSAGSANDDQLRRP